MQIAIYGRKFSDDAVPFVQQLFDCLHDMGVQTVVYDPFSVYLSSRILFRQSPVVFTTHEELVANTQFLISIGGDGTLLDTITLVRDSGIPVVGMNMGRLGFLASIAKEEITNAIDSLLKGHYTIDKRTLLRLDADRELFEGVNYGLNELVIHKKDTSSMIIIHTYLNGQFLNSYWADGLIVSTPTGSTGYNLSCGGPIVFPRSESFIVTPISPHNLNVRPIIISDNSIVSFEIEGRSSYFNVSLDSRNETVESSVQLAVRKENFQLNLLRLNNENYLGTLRNKLMWGLDSRN